MATLRIINSKSECVADALTAQSFVDFKKRCAEEGFGRVALVVTLDCGEEIFMRGARVSSSSDSHGARATRLVC